MALAKGTQLQPDPEALERPTEDLGWVGVDADAPATVALRAQLEQQNGIPGLEVVDPTEVERATRIFRRDGFVVVRNALDDDQLAFVQAGCERVVREMLALDQARVGNRGSHRYSFGGASRTGHLLHHPEWASLIDVPTVTPILTSIFGSSDYIARGAGGDFCLPGAVDYQPLHSDMSDRVTYTFPTGETHTFGSFHDPSGQLTYRDLPCPYVCCNFLMVDFTRTNGPTRQIPGTQNSREPMPSVEEEPSWMKLSTVCPAPAGSVLIRDVRAWHGGTPNLSRELRAIPNAEFYAPWFRESLPISMPREIYETLSEHGQRVCRYIVAPPGEELRTGYLRNLGGSPFPDA